MNKIFLLVSWYFLLAVTMVSFLYGGALLWERFRPAQFEELSAVSAVEVVAQEAEPQVLSFTRIEMDVPVTRGEVREDHWITTQDTASFVPFETGNGVGWILYGHNFPRVLGRLHEVREDDVVELRMSDGQTQRFVVTEKKEVYPEYIDSILPSDEETLVMYTCSGFLDSRRLVVRARMVGNE